MRSLLPLLTVLAAAVPATALAAPEPGSYRGTSSGTYIQVGQAEEPTDEGKVAFKVRSGKVLDFRVRDQLFQCGPPAEVPVSVARIRLDDAGKGSATYEHPAVGPLKVTIKVTAAGRASGTIRRPRSATGLCNPDYPVRFTAKER